MCIACLFFVTTILFPPSHKWGNWAWEGEVPFSKVIFSLLLGYIFPTKAAFYAYHLDFIFQVSLYQIWPIEILPMFLTSYPFLLALEGCQWIKPSLSSSQLLIRRLNRLVPRAEPWGHLPESSSYVVSIHPSTFYAGCWFTGCELTLIQPIFKNLVHRFLSNSFSFSSITPLS